MRAAPVVLFLLAPLVFLAAWQGPPQAKKKVVAKTRVGPVIPPPPPQPGPNDRLWIDADGNLAARGATTKSDQRALDLSFRRRVHVRPVVTATIRKVEDACEYNYTVANQPDARQWIHLFWIDALGPVENVQTPEYWSLVGINQDKTPISRAFIGRHATDSDVRERLVPGVSATGFSIVSKSLPGLVAAHFSGHLDPDGDEGFANPALDTGDVEMSDWLRNEILERLNLDNNSAHVYILGPKIIPGGDLFTAVRNELALAARLQDFSPEKDQLLAMTTADSPDQVRTLLAEFAAKSSGFRSQFYRLMEGHLRAH